MNFSAGRDLTIGGSKAIATVASDFARATTSNVTVAENVDQESNGHGVEPERPAQLPELFPPRPRKRQIKMVIEVDRTATGSPKRVKIRRDEDEMELEVRMWRHLVNVKLLDQRARRNPQAESAVENPPADPAAANPQAARRSARHRGHAARVDEEIQ